MGKWFWSSSLKVSIRNLSGIIADTGIEYHLSAPFTSVHELFSGGLFEDVKSSDTYVENCSQIHFQQKCADNVQWCDF